MTRGIQGPKGDKGETGVQGVPGLQGPQGSQGPAGANFTHIAAGEQRSVSIQGVGYFYLGCGPGGVAADRYIVGIGSSAAASVWIDDSIAGLSYRTLPADNFDYLLNGDSGTRHLVIRMSNSTKSGTWNVYIEGSAANGCAASIQSTP